MTELRIIDNPMPNVFVAKLVQVAKDQQQRDLYVPVELVTAVTSDDDLRDATLPPMCWIHTGPRKKRVLGTPEEVLRKLGWTVIHVPQESDTL